MQHSGSNMTVDISKETESDNGEEVTVASSESTNEKGKTVTVLKKPRKKKAKKPKEMPRRPLSAYNFFFREQRELILQEREVSDTKDADGNLFSSMAKTIGKRWKETKPENVERFNLLAEKDLKRYRREMDDYQLKLAKKHPTISTSPESSKTPITSNKMTEKLRDESLIPQSRLIPVSRSPESHAHALHGDLDSMQLSAAAASQKSYTARVMMQQQHESANIEALRRQNQIISAAAAAAGHPSIPGSGGSLLSSSIPSSAASGLPPSMFLEAYKGLPRSLLAQQQPGSPGLGLGAVLGGGSGAPVSRNQDIDRVMAAIALRDASQSQQKLEQDLQEQQWLQQQLGMGQVDPRLLLMLSNERNGSALDREALGAAAAMDPRSLSLMAGGGQGLMGDRGVGGFTSSPYAAGAFGSMVDEGEAPSTAALARLVAMRQQQQRQMGLPPLPGRF